MCTSLYSLSMYTKGSMICVIMRKVLIAAHMYELKSNDGLEL